MRIEVAAPAKINLFLHITGKRADGYHLLESLVSFADASDLLEIAPAEELQLEVTGPFASSLISVEENLVLRAAKALQQQAGITAGARIILHKNLPVASGIGGGSADAAACLRGLVQLWDIGMDEAALMKLALPLGSDVPVCLAAHAAWMRGIGELLAPVPLPGLHAVLVNPGVEVPTADIFRAFSGTFVPPVSPPERFPSPEALIDFLGQTCNMLEPAAVTVAPVIGEVLAVLHAEGALLTRMSGSGATCFGIYRNADAAASAATHLGKEKPAWWCRATALC